MVEGKNSSAPIKIQLVNCTIYSDASLEGCERTDGEMHMSLSWVENENISYKNSLELLATFLCLKSFCKNKSGINMLSRLDNTTAVP